MKNKSNKGPYSQDTNVAFPLTSAFLGPHAENADEWSLVFNRILTDYIYWRRNYYADDGFALGSDDMTKNEQFFQRFHVFLEKMLCELKQNFPFHSPRYMGHMLSEQSLPAVAGYVATMLYNPNNCTEEAAPITVAKEIELGKRICAMLGLPVRTSWAHVCSGGSAATLEALWVARQSQFLPLVIQDICKKYRWELNIKLPDHTAQHQSIQPITSCSVRTLLHIKTNESAYLLPNLLNYLIQCGSVYSMDALVDSIEILWQPSDSTAKSEQVSLLSLVYAQKGENLTDMLSTLLSKCGQSHLGKAIRDICKNQCWRVKSSVSGKLQLVERLPDQCLERLAPQKLMRLLCELVEHMILNHLVFCPSYETGSGDLVARIKPNKKDFSVSPLSYVFVDTGENAVARIKCEMATSQYNIRTHGYANVIAKIGLRPVLFVPQSAHYSLRKTANLLGYGEASIRPLPTDQSFRVDVGQDQQKLYHMLTSIREDEYIAAVVAVFGTTEEGAVDPIHRFEWVRNRACTENQMYFWLHVDAAWGGYIAVMRNTNSMITSVTNQDSFEDKIKKYIQEINVHEIYEVALPNYHKQQIARWDDREVYAAMFALSAADSITVDPHKMGYVPYPAGAVAFKNKRHSYLLRQQATYIGTEAVIAARGIVRSADDVERNVFGFNDNFDIKQIGSYTLEGSRPGAAVMSCWFASEVIPLDLRNHGKIVRTTLLNARRFFQYLSRHRRITFVSTDEQLQKSAGLSACKTPFTFEAVYNNIDTNVVCFFVKPMKWCENYQTEIEKHHFPQMTEDTTWSYEEIMEINRRIHHRLTITPSDETDGRRRSTHQKFYVSSTTFKTDAYSAESMSATLKKFGFSEEEYRKNGLFVMRSTMMNPWYYHVQQSDTNVDYFKLFIEELHYAARKTIDEMAEGKRI